MRSPALSLTAVLMLALASASATRAKYFKIGTTEEGGDIVLLAIADEATIK